MSIDRATDKLYANSLNLIPELGPVKLMKLVNHFGDFKAAWESTQSELTNAGLDSKTISAVKNKQATIDRQKEWDLLTLHKIKVLTLDDTDYPTILKEIASPPPILYVRGETKYLNKLGIAVVGTRKISQYGIQVTDEIVAGLAQNNLSIISGLAFGVDAAALAVCIKNQSTPIAILASDLADASISPRSNFNLAQEIISHGCLVSEYALGSSVQKQNFPIRNRLIAGLSIGTLVIEADEESGSLITANYALEQNREVFSIPGSIFSPTSRGTNKLIKKGAKLVNHVADILEELNIEMPEITQTKTFEETYNENQVMQNLKHEPTHIDDLVKKVGLPVNEINATLSMLELKGRIKNLGGASYAKVR
jgi:DNA processing protein